MSQKKTIFKVLSNTKDLNSKKKTLTKVYLGKKTLTKVLMTLKNLRRTFENNSVGYKNYKKQCPGLEFRLIPKLISWAGLKPKKLKIPLG